MKNIPELGDEVICKVSGFKGIVTSHSKCLTGCDRMGVRAPMTKDGKMGEEYWIDQAALTVVKKGKVKPSDVQDQTQPKRGGPPTAKTW